MFLHHGFRTQTLSHFETKNQFKQIFIQYSLKLYIFLYCCDFIYIMYPKNVMTKSKKGKIEVRSLIDAGRFVRYEYLEPETGKRSENKYKLILIPKKQNLNAKGTLKVSEFFIVPIAGGRFLMIPAEEKGSRAVWDGKKAVKIL
jgi:hypothetical protein